MRIEKSFFKAEEVFFIGYSRKHSAFCKRVKEAFEKTGARVYPVNPRGGTGEVEVYRSPEEAGAKPSFAYILTNKAVTSTLVDGLAAAGVKRVLFNSPLSVDAATLDRCTALGMETAVACPLMALGGGIHRVHGFLAGVRG